MLAWWMQSLWEQNPVILVSWIYWVIFSIIFHELAHGWAAIACGDRTPIESGHMTWNPLVHMGPMSLIMFALVGIAWGLMPIDPSRFRRRSDEALVAAAGPFMNLVLAVAALLLYTGWIGLATPASVGPILHGNVIIFLKVGVMLNLTLCLFNLLPAPPLDGSRILATFIPPYRRLLQSEQGAYLALAMLVVLFIFAGEYIFAAAMRITGLVTGTIEMLIAPGGSP